jgi:hypothetical protein
VARKKLYIPLQPIGRDTKTLTAEEVQAWLGGDLANTVVIRSILMAEMKAVRKGHARELRTQRGLWYEIVKPLISRAGVLYRPKRTDGKPVDWNQLLSVVLADLVREKQTTYEELMILDGSRQRQSARSLSAQLINVKLVGAHFPWVILFTEKDTIWPVLRDLANLYGVSDISGGGQPSCAATENIIRKIVRSKAYKIEQPEAIVVLSLTDYDPAGYSISESQVNQIKEAVNGMDPSERGNKKSVTSKRLGLTPDQLTPQEISANAYEPAKKGLAAWVKETGGINGQPLGLELDSLPISRLRDMFASEIEAVVDMDKRRNDLREAFVDQMACKQLLPEFDKQRAALISQAKASEAWQDIMTVQLEPNLFSQAAINGAYWISPQDIQYLYRDCQDPLVELWQQGED